MMQCCNHSRDEHCLEKLDGPGERDPHPSLPVWVQGVSQSHTACVGTGCLRNQDTNTQGVSLILCQYFYIEIKRNSMYEYQI